MSVCAKFQLPSMSRSGWKVSVGGVVGWWGGVQSHFQVKPNFRWIVIELTLSWGFDNWIGRLGVIYRSIWGTILGPKLVLAEPKTLFYNSGWLPTMRLPQKIEVNSQHRGFSTTIRLRHNTNNEATSQQWGYITKMRPSHNIEITSKHCSYPKTMRLQAALQHWGYFATMRLPHSNMADSQE